MWAGAPPGPAAPARDAFHASIAAMTGATFMKFGRAPHTCSTRKGASLTDASP